MKFHGLVSLGKHGEENGYNGHESLASENKPARKLNLLMPMRSSSFFITSLHFLQDARPDLARSMW